MTEKGSHSYIIDPRNENVHIFINGDLYPRDRARISVFDSGFLLGDGIWESMRLLNNHLVFLDEHLDRLYHGANQLALDIGKNRQELVSIIQKTLDAIEWLIVSSAYPNQDDITEILKHCQKYISGTDIDIIRVDSIKISKKTGKKPLVICEVKQNE